MIKQMLKKINYYEAFIIVIGNLMLGFSYGALLVPKQIVSGGSSGIAIILEDIAKISPSITISILAWSFFVLGIIFLGKKFAIKTLPATIILPLGAMIAENWTWLIMQVETINESWLIAVIASLLGGAGIALTFKAGGSTGGFDILGYIIQKIFKIRITVSLFIIDMVIMFIGAYVLSLEQVLIGIAVSLFTNLVIDRILFGGTDTLIAQIISSKHEEILNYIHYSLGRGSTIINIIGGYSQKDKKMIQVVLDKRQFELLREMILEIDKDAFIVLIGANTVIGKGFKEWDYE